jgi:DNA-binding CsgD family transcriptional regulator/PAS domain-containing protein
MLLLRGVGADVDISSAQTEKLLDLIYDAATENELWRHVLTEIADLTHSQGGILFGVSFAANQVYFDFNGRMDEECKRVFQERHMVNPWSKYMVHQPVGRLVVSDEAVDIAELRASSFYDEVLRPQGVAHSAMMALAARDDFRAAFNICRSAAEGPLGEEERRIIEWLTPHMRRSMTMGFRLDSYRALQQAAFDVLDRFSDGVIVLDSGARVVFANVAARQYEIEGLLGLGHGRQISTWSLTHSQRLAELVRSASEGAAGAAMSLPHGADGQLLTLVVTPVRSKDFGRLAEAGIKDAAVLLFVIDPVNRRSIPLGQLMGAYGLTRAEARVALAASSGNTVIESARLLGLSPNTIKTHLRRVFAKTATARQAELAGLIASVGAVRFPDGKAE